MALRHLLTSAATFHRLTSNSLPCLLRSVAIQPYSTQSQSTQSFSTCSALQPTATISLLPRICCQDGLMHTQMMQVRHMSKLKPKFTGGKLRPFSSFSERFKVTGSGLIVFKRPGHRHKRFSKGPHRNRQLRRTQVLTNAYTTTMKKLGFVSRHY